MPHHLTKQPTSRRADSSAGESSRRLSEDSTPELKPRAPAGLAIVYALRTALSRMRNHEQAAKCGDPEGVHRLRSSSRRLRSELGALEEMVEPQWREKVEGELKWLA